MDDSPKEIDKQPKQDSDFCPTWWKYRFSITNEELRALCGYQKKEGRPLFPIKKPS